MWYDVTQIRQPAAGAGREAIEEEVRHGSSAATPKLSARRCSLRLLAERIASSIPAAHALGEYRRFRSLLRSPMHDRSLPSRASSSMREASWLMSPAGITRPFQWSSTRSAAQPAALEQITGNPHAMASLTTRPHGSV